MSDDLQLAIVLSVLGLGALFQYIWKVRNDPYNKVKREIEARQKERLQSEQPVSTTRKPTPEGWRLHCQCERIPYGEYKVLETPEGPIMVTIEDEIKYSLQSKPLKVKAPDHVVTMTIRLWNSREKVRTMEPGAGGKLEYQWEFTFPTCDCGPERIYHRPGSCRAQLEPATGSLVFQVLKDSDSNPIGPP